MSMLARNLSIRPMAAPYPGYHQNRFATAQGGSDPAAPTAPGVSAGGGGGGGALTMFQRSVNKERAMNAFRAATFAANAAPAAPGQSAWGAGPAGDRNGAAARTAYVASKMAEANAEDFGSGDNVFARADEAAAESGRKDRTVESESGVRDAQADVLGSQARGTDAYTKTVLPTIAQQNQAQSDAARAGAESTRGANSRANYLLEPQSAMLRAQARGANAAAGAAEAEAPFIPGQRQAEGDLSRSRANLNNAQATAVARPPAAPMPEPPDPGGLVDAMTKRNKLVTDQASQLYSAQPWWKRWVPGPGMNHEDALQEAEKRVPQVGATQPAGQQKPVTPADLEATARQYGMTIEQVKQRLGLR